MILILILICPGYRKKVPDLDLDLDLDLRSGTRAATDLDLDLDLDLRSGTRAATYLDLDLDLGWTFNWNWVSIATLVVPLCVR